MKDKYDEKALLKHLPHEMNDFYKYISTLQYYDKPNYQVTVVKKLFYMIFRLRGISYVNKINGT